MREFFTGPANVYFLVLAANICFSTSSLVFAEMSRRLSPVWMNFFKVLVAWVAFAIAVFFFTQWQPVGNLIWGALLLSGIMGLAIGDMFLLTAYVRLGAARTLILFGFQPFFIGVSAHFLLGQEITWLKTVAVLFFLLCLFTFSLEKFRQHGHWEIWGLVAALIGVLFDNSGVLLTRWSFDHAPAMDPMQANLIRCTGALAFFVVFSFVRPVHLVKGFQLLETRQRVMALGSAFLGTFMSLMFYLIAVRTGHLASISAMAVCGPLLTSVFECIYYRRWPNRYLLTALGFFLIGFAVLTWA